MLMRVAAVVLLFLIRLQFPRSKSVSDILCKRYGQSTLKRIRRFEKLANEYENLKNLIIIYAQLNWI